jgi:inner membrane protein
MPTIFTHTVVACAAGTGCAGKKMPLRFWILSIIVAVLPDADVIGLSYGIPYAHVLGHRGFFHSLTFALILSLLVVFLFFKNQKPFSRDWGKYVLYFFLLGASHGILDAFTDGGLGIALFWPFETGRHFAPWRPIEVSPIYPGALLSARGMSVLWSEIVYVWLPLSVAAVIVRVVGKRWTLRLNSGPDRNGRIRKV